MRTAAHPLEDASPGATSEAARERATAPAASARSSAPRRATWSSGTTSTPTRSRRSISRPRSFPSGDPTSQLLATAGIFAAGFFMRPLGGWLFGWIADTARAQELDGDLGADDVRRLADDRLLPTYATIGARRRRCCSSRAWSRACRSAASTARPRPT